MRARRVRRAGAVLVWSTLLAGAAGATASPDAPPTLHTALEATFPAADSVYTGNLLEVRLRYTTAVQRALSTITLVRPAGEAVAAGPVETVPGSEEREIRIRLSAPLESGDYTVRWTTAGPDSHPLSGSFAFTVDRPVEAPGAVAPVGEPAAGTPTLVAAGEQEESAEAARDPIGILVRALFLVSILGMLGTALFRLAVLGPLTGDPLLSETMGHAAASTRALGWGVVALTLVALPARLWKQSTDLFGAEALAPENLGRILGTPWGGAWLLQAAAGVLFAIGLATVGRGEGRARGWQVAAFAGLAAAFVPALSGHASATTGGVRPFAVLNDALHVTAAGTWMGTLAVLLLAGLPALARGAPLRPGQAGGAAILPPLARMVNGFSRVALAAVGTLLATGLVSARLQVGTPGALLDSRYGLTLLLKLALVFGAAAAGLYNWRVVRPALERDPTPHRLRTSAIAEVLLGLLIVVVTAALIVTPLP